MAPSVSHLSPDVGRCDHTYAEWIVNNSANLRPDDVVIFMKDTHVVHQYRSVFRNLSDMLRIVKESGFACATRPTHLSIYHNTSILETFVSKGYKGKTFRSNMTLGKWWLKMGIHVPRPFAPVCYGGHFATTGRQLQQVDSSIFKAIMKSLEVGDNNAERHYAERTWAALMSPRLSCESTAELRGRANAAMRVTYMGMLGTLKKCLRRPRAISVPETCV